MAAVVEKHKAWIEFGKNATASVVDGAIAIAQIHSYPAMSSYIEISAADAPAVIDWLRAKLHPAPSIWSRLAAHSAVKTEGV